MAARRIITQVGFNNLVNDDGRPSDTITLGGLRFFGYHGVYAEEQARGQEFVVDLIMELDLSRAGQSDDLADTVNYAEVYGLVKGIVEGSPYKLIEAVAARLIEAVLTGYAPVQAVTVRINKPQAPVGDPTLGSATVEMRRLRK